MDTALVRVCADIAVGDADCHPYGPFLDLTLADNLHYPALFGVCYREGFTVGAVSVFLHQGVEDAYRLAGGLGPLQGYVYEGAVVHHPVGVAEIAAAEGGLAYYELVLVYVAHRLEGVAELRNFAAVTAAVPVVNREHRPGGPGCGRAEIELSVQLVRIGGIAHYGGAVGRGPFGYDDVGAGENLPPCEEGDDGKEPRQLRTKFHIGFCWRNIVVCYEDTKKGDCR